MKHATFVTLAALALCLWLSFADAASALDKSRFTANVDRTDIAIYLYMPRGAGPFPLIVLSHGSPRKAEARATLGADTMHAQAEAYAGSGVAAAVPIRRGYAGQGRWAESYRGCERADYCDAGLAGARDIRAAVAVVSKLPHIDRKRIVLMGWSAGGWASLAAGTKGGIMGVVNFAGGRGSKGPDEVCEPEHLVEAAGRYGKASRAPELWIYSLNDRFFGPQLAHRMYDAFVAAGAKAEFVAAPAFKDDGHRYVAAISAWRPRVDKFFRSIGFL